MKRLRNSLERVFFLFSSLLLYVVFSLPVKKMSGRYPDLITKYQRLVKDIMADSFSDQLHAVVQLVSSNFLILIF